MYEKNFFKRLGNFGWKRIFFSLDSFGFIIVFFLTYILTRGDIPLANISSALDIFIQVSSSLFAIVLAGLAIVTSFTDKEFVYVWKKIGEFDNMITIFQFNLFIPIIVLLFSIMLKFLFYKSILAIILIALFAYMILSLIDLINFVCRYGLQRGEFISQLKSEK